MFVLVDDFLDAEFAKKRKERKGVRRASLPVGRQERIRMWNSKVKSKKLMSNRFNGRFSG